MPSPVSRLDFMIYKGEKHAAGSVCNRVCYLGLKVVARLVNFIDTVFGYFQDSKTTLKDGRGFQELWTLFGLVCFIYCG